MAVRLTIRRDDVVAALDQQPVAANGNKVPGTQWTCDSVVCSPNAQVNPRVPHKRVDNNPKPRRGTRRVEPLVRRYLADSGLLSPTRNSES